MHFLADKINNKIEKLSIRRGKCRIWTGMIDSMGYAKAKLSPHWSKGGRVSRMVLLVKLGRPPLKSEWACHTCDNILCVEPDHIYIGNAFTNNRDTVTRKRRSVLKIDGTTSQLIRDDYSTGLFTQDKLGTKYGISQVRVSQIIRSI